MLMYAKLMKTMVKVGVLLIILGLSSPASAVTFTYTGAAQTYVIPAGYTAVALDVIGSASNTATVTQGRGGRVQTTISVTPGETLYIYVGGTTSWPNGAISPVSGRGGGSSDVRKGGNTTANIVAIAGGGGGMGDVNTSGGMGETPELMGGMAATLLDMVVEVLRKPLVDEVV